MDAFNQYMVDLRELENELLERLANAPEDILSDIPLIEGLEATKKAALEIEAAVEKGKQTEMQINIAREKYRPAASEAAMEYFIITPVAAMKPPRARAGGGDGDESDCAADLLAELSIAGT